MKERNLFKILFLCFISLFLFCGCEFVLDDYSLICDDDGKNCNEYNYNYDEYGSSYNDDISDDNYGYGESTGYGKEVPVTDELKEACRWMLNPESIKIRLYTCSDKHMYKDPQGQLLGGAYETTVRGEKVWMSKEAMTFKTYQLGVFAGEINPYYEKKNERDTFAIIYRTVILKSLIPAKLSGKTWFINENGEYLYRAGSCAQNYKMKTINEYYYSGKYKDTIDQVMADTAYMIVVNKDGKITDVRYNTRSGIEPLIKQADREGKGYKEIIEVVLKSGHDLSHYYKDAVVYDCRNLATSDTLNNQSGNTSLGYNDKDYGTGTWVYHSKKDPELSKYYSNHWPFAEYVPERAVSSGDSLPLIIWIHGGDLKTALSAKDFQKSGMLRVVDEWADYKLANIPAIIIAPHLDVENASWSLTRSSDTIRAIYKYAKDKYNIDSNRVVLMGHSMGGGGVITLSSKNQDMFSALVIMSAAKAHPDKEYIEYYKNVPMKGYTEGEEETNGDQMRTFFKDVDHYDDLTLYTSIAHGYVPRVALTEDKNSDGISDLIYWALSQSKNGTGSNTQNVTLSNINVIYTGDSRTTAYNSIKKQLGFDDNKETIYAKSGTRYDDDFKSHLTSAKNKMNNNSSKTFALTVNYGVNDLKNYNNFCNYYKTFVKSMDSKNQFYIVSVTPMNGNPWYTNAEVETFNSYMKDTCVPEIKSSTSKNNVYYCDIYNKISMSNWINYIIAPNDKDRTGAHYTTEGSTFIYNSIKECIMRNN